jgi:hypothetical protein
MTRFVSLKRRSALVAAAVCSVAGLVAAVPASAAQRVSAPIVRDHGPKPIVRDHRSQPIVRDHRTPIKSTAQVVAPRRWHSQH